MAAILQWQPALVAVKRFLQPWVAFTFTVAFPLLHLEFYHLRHKLPLFPVPVRTVLLLLTVAAINYGFLLWILATVFHPRSWTTRLLEMRVFRFVGRISYSLYLWHVLFFFRSHPQSAITNPVLLFLSQPGLRWMMAFSVATLSYYFIEKPLIRLGHRLAPPATPGRLELADLPVEAPAPGWELPAT